jgi:hypothetical protein
MQLLKYSTTASFHTIPVTVLCLGVDTTQWTTRILINEVGSEIDFLVFIHGANFI